MSSSPTTVSALGHRLTSCCPAKVGRDMLGHLAKYEDEFWPPGYCVALFKQLDSVCWVD